MFPQLSYRQKRVVKFWWQVDKSGGMDACWHWTRNCGSIGFKSYGQYYLDGKKVYTHALAYRLTNGEIPPRMEVCHTCDTPWCCNPKHLYMGTHQQNMQDRSRKGRGGGSLGAKTGIRNPIVDFPVREPNRASGSRNAHSKLTEDQVRRIRIRYAEGNISQRALAKEYGVNPAQIGFIVRWQVWQHVAVEPVAAPSIIQLPLFAEPEKKAA